MDASTPILKGALTATVVSLKGAGGKVTWIDAYNPNASAAFIQLFNAATAAAVTLGTTPPTMSIGLAASVNNPIVLGTDGAAFPLGIQVAATTTYNGSSAPGSAVVANFGVKGGQ